MDQRQIEHPAVKGWGADLAPEKRPGVPMEREPRPVGAAYWTEPARMPERPGRERLPRLQRLTPVYGTAQPLRGLSGRLRRAAYGYPDHWARHWLLLLAADRVDVLEHSGMFVPLIAGLAGTGLLAGGLLRRREAPRHREPTPLRRVAYERRRAEVLH